MVNMTWGSWEYTTTREEELTSIKSPLPNQLPFRRTLTHWGYKYTIEPILRIMLYEFQGTNVFSKVKNRSGFPTGAIKK